MKNVLMFLRRGFFVGVVVFVLALCSFGQVTEPASDTVSSTKPPTKEKSTLIEPVLKDVDGVAIGMTADQVKDKLGRPETADDTGMLFSRNNGETVQVGLDSDGKVKMIAAIYTGKNAEAPDFSTVFGQTSEAPSSTDGKIYKMIRYPSAGYWVAYSRLNLDNGPMTTVTIQKMQLPK
jgi:hypothetical protein